MCWVSRRRSLGFANLGRQARRGKVRLEGGCSRTGVRTKSQGAFIVCARVGRGAASESGVGKALALMFGDVRVVGSDCTSPAHHLG